MKISLTQQSKANAAIAKGMTFALGMWFIPIPVLGSAACNKAETVMIEEILEALSRPKDPDRIEKYFWFFRKKYFLMNLVTFLPYAGATVQLVDVYALGQFVLSCCEEDVEPTNERALNEVWSKIEPKIWETNQIIIFYENASGSPFPGKIKPAFISTMNKLGKIAQGVNHVPGLEQGQEMAGEAFRKGIHAAESGVRSGIKGIGKLFR